MRIGKHELAILEYIDSTGEYHPTYNSIRKKVGLNDVYTPRQLDVKARIWVNERASGDRPISLEYALKCYKRWYWYENRIKFSQAINRLIKKGLVARRWEVTIDGGRVEIITLSEHIHLIGDPFVDEDVPSVWVDKEKMYRLTSKGKIELDKRRRRLEK